MTCHAETISGFHAEVGAPRQFTQRRLVLYHGCCMLTNQIAQLKVQSAVLSNSPPVGKGSQGGLLGRMDN